MPFINSVRGSFGPQGKSRHALGRLAASTTGGSVTQAGGYQIHTFTSGTQTFFPIGLGNVEVFVLGGGGGGGSGESGAGAAGSGLYSSSFFVNSANLLIP